MGDRPTGTVTFLFTDVEGSTGRWQADRSAMEVALAAHDEVLRTCVEGHDGQVVKHTGDGIMAVFTSAPDAVAAATQAQAQLALPVRMGVHTGEAQLRDGDYFGPTLNRAARIMGAGHGRQILVSSSTAPLLAGVEGVQLVDLGSHRLKDLVRLEQIWQVGVAVYPPLRVLDATPGNLPPEPPELFGREEAIADIARQLKAGRLVSLVGVGGVGKTSLALAVADAVRGDYPDGVWLVELAPLGDPDAVVPVVAGVFSHVAQAGTTLRDSLRNLLAPKELLLVLDNCEHLVDEVADLVGSILRASRTVQILLTSREGLGVAHEHQVTVASLRSAGEHAPAVELFAARARQVQADFEVDESNAADITAICERLDGIPLAIELAATRVRSLSPSELRERLADRFRLLAGGRRRVTERHQTLRHTVQWSYDLLTPTEQALLNRLSVFAGGFTLDAAETVCSDGIVDRLDVLDTLDSLVSKSLVVAEQRDGATRYRLLETIRQFAEEELDAAGETGDVHRRCDRYFLDTFASLVMQYAEGTGVGVARWFDVEFDNLRATFESVLLDDADAAGWLCAASVDLCWTLLRYEALTWPARVLENRPGTDDGLAAALLGASTWQLIFGGNLTDTRPIVDQALELNRLTPAPAPALEPWLAVMGHAVVSGDGPRLLAIVDECRQTNGPGLFWRDICWFYETWAQLMMGDRASSRRVALAPGPSPRDGPFDLYVDWALARVEDDPATAIALYERATDAAARLHLRFYPLAFQREIGRLHVAAGRPRAGIEALAPAMEQWFAAGDLANWSSVLRVVALALSALGEEATTAELLGTSADRGAFTRSISFVSDADLDEVGTRCRAALGNEEFERRYESGRRASDKEIMDGLRAAITDILAAPERPAV